MTNSLSASVTGRSNVLRARIDDLTARERQLLDALGEVRAGLAKSREELIEAERAQERIKQPGKRAALAEATWRQTVRQLRTFTVSELATELGCSTQTATKHLKTMIDAEMVKPAGRVMGKALFEYAKPTGGPGEAFESQQEKRRHLTPVPEVVADLAVKRTGTAVAGTGGGMVVSNKDVRQACEEAQRRGWKLSKKGDGHFVLVNGPRRVPVSGTPRSGTAEADKIRRMTRAR
jgi:hypothetical protein